MAGSAIQTVKHHTVKHNMLYSYLKIQLTARSTPVLVTSYVCGLH